MGTGTYSENHHHHHHHKNLHPQRNGNPAASSSSSTNKIFLPILCRVSVKDTIAHHPRTICPKQDDPSSPRVSCMGQVKHHHHNHHLTPSSTTSTAKPHHKIVPGKTRNNTTKCNQAMVDQRRRRRQVCTRFSTSNNVHDKNSCGAVVPVLNLAELDPPLPVIRRPCHGDNKPVSLWRRRSRGDDGLANIQIPTFQCIFSVQFRPSTST